MRGINTVGGHLPEYLEMLWRFAYRLSQSQETAQELTQETCLRALEYQTSYSGGNLKSWLFKIMHNLWRDEVRHTVRAGLKLVNDDPETLLVSSPDSQEQQVLLREVQQMINQLPEAQRTVLMLVAVEGFSYRETAELLEVPMGTIMSRLARARERLGHFVQQESVEFVVTQQQEWLCKK